MLYIPPHPVISLHPTVLRPSQMAFWDKFICLLMIVTWLWFHSAFTFQMILKASDWCYQKKQTQSSQKVIKTWCKWQTLGSLHQFLMFYSGHFYETGCEYKAISNEVVSKKAYFVKLKPKPLFYGLVLFWTNFVDAFWWVWSGNLVDTFWCIWCT